MNPLAIAFLFLVGVFLPYLSIKSSRRLGTGTPMPPRKSMFIQSIVLLSLMLLLSLATARVSWIRLFPSAPVTLSGIGAAALFLAVGVGSMPARWKYRSRWRKERLYALLPQTPSDRLLWVGVCVAAAVSEEITYRGVLFTLLVRLSGNAWIAAAVAAAIFSLAHVVQGWRTVGVVFFLALGSHAVVAVSGSLVPAMVVHFLYDLFVGFYVSRVGARELVTEH